MAVFTDPMPNPDVEEDYA
jgi:hypothetical protein